MLKYIIQYVLDHAPEEMAFLNQYIDKELLNRLHHVVNSDFAHVTYTEAVELLKKHQEQFTYPVEWGWDLQTEHERYLTEQVFQRPVFVTDYPKEIKAFYMKLNPDGKTVAAMDCLVPGIGEIHECVLFGDHGSSESSDPAAFDPVVRHRLPVQGISGISVLGIYDPVQYRDRSQGV